MKIKMQFVLASALLALSMSVNAQEAEAKGTAAQEIVVAQELPQPPAQTALKKINAFLAQNPSLKRNYDEKNGRIIVVSEVRFNVKDPEVSDEFVRVRRVKMHELLIQAKCAIISTIYQRVSAERILEIPGNPIAEQLEEEQKAMNEALKIAVKQLRLVGEDFEEALVDKERLTASELLASITSIFSSKDKENYASKLTEEKKARYEKAKTALREAQEKYNLLLTQAETLKGKISRSLRGNVSSQASMPLLGCTVLAQAESFDEKNGTYTYHIAIAYAWSAEMEKAAAELLQGRPVKFTAGKRSLEEWLERKAQNGALATWIGPRNYIDNNGDMWFIGISAAPEATNANRSMQMREIAELESTGEVMFSLFANAYSKKAMEILGQSKQLSLDAEEDKVYTSLSLCQGEALKDKSISGLGVVFSDTVKHPDTGLEIQIVVSAVSSGSQTSLRSIHDNAYALAIEVNTTQEFERGRKDRQEQADAESKDNPAARQAGAASANQDLKARQNARNQQRNATSAAQSSPQPQPASSTQKGRLVPGTSSMILDDDD